MSIVVGFATTTAVLLAPFGFRSGVRVNWAKSGRLSPIVLKFLLISLVTGLFIWGKLAVFQLDAIEVSPDTRSYVNVAGLNALSLPFWEAERPFTLPLLYKLLGLGGGADLMTSDLARVTLLQLMLSIIAWGFLATIVATRLRSPAARMVGYLVVLAFALSLDISQWDRLLLSESVSNSLLAIVLGLSLIGAAKWDQLKNGGRMVPIGFVSAWLAATVLYSFSRDANAYFLLFQAGLLAVAGAILSLRQGRLALPLLAVAASFVLVFVVQARSANHGFRWIIPFQNVLHDRILPDDTAVQYFRQQGLPISPDQRSRLVAADYHTFRRVVDNSSDLKALNSWLRHQGRAAYLSYLVSNPWRTAIAALRNYPSLISPLSSEYRSSLESDPGWVKSLTAVLFPRSAGLVIVLSVLVSVGWAISGWRGLVSNPMRFVCGLLILSALPMMIFVWHADSVEVERHAAQIALQLRLAIWLAVLLAADAWLSRRQASLPTGTAP